MGDVISLTDRRSRRTTGTVAQARTRVCFYFDLGSPWTYLAAERVDRLFEGVLWRPAHGATLSSGPQRADVAHDVERRAAQLRLPLVWPETWSGVQPRAMRVATLAADEGRAAAFVLAAGRLAFCGGYDLDEDEVLLEASAAAGLDLEAAMEAADDPLRNALLHDEAVGLAARGARSLPALLIDRRLYCGEHRLAEAAAALYATPAHGSTPA